MYKAAVEQVFVTNVTNAWENNINVYTTDACSVIVSTYHSRMRNAVSSLVATVR
jgi:hypothetical protein